MKQFSDFPRVSLGILPTPLYRLPNISEAMGKNIYIKRDDFDTGMQGNNLVLVCKNRLVDALECHALALGARTFLGQIVNTKYHILGRNGYRTTIGRF